jgi:hypothetical protein
LIGSSCSFSTEVDFGHNFSDGLTVFQTPLSGDALSETFVVKRVEEIKYKLLFYTSVTGEQFAEEVGVLVFRKVGPNFGVSRVVFIWC